jgi:hypothetical protein
MWMIMNAEFRTSMEVVDSCIRVLFEYDAGMLTTA